jgi:hypothetical protein
VRFGADDPAVWHEQAVALLSAGDSKGYRLACGRMLKKFGNRPDARRALADACALGADALADYKDLLAAAEGAARAGDPEEAARHAALLLRAGQAAKAAEVLEKLAEGSARPADLWLLAVAQARAGRQDRAKQWRTRAAEAPAREGSPWTERQAAALWKREAEGG